MKKLFLVILGLIIITPLFAAISPLDRKIQKAQIEYNQKQMKCPDDKPLFVNGACMACNEYKNWNDVAGILGCEKCKNSNSCFGNHCCLNCPSDRPVLLSNGSCVPCNYKSTNGPRYDVIKGQEKCYIKCPKEKPLLMTNGKCASCNVKDYNVSGCEKCPNRQMRHNVCYFTCPDNKPVLLRTGTCKTCNQILREYKNLPNYNVLSGWEKCPFKIK